MSINQNYNAIGSTPYFPGASNAINPIVNPVPSQFQAGNSNTQFQQSQNTVGMQQMPYQTQPQVQMPIQNQTNQFSNIFLQPSGRVYIINNSSESDNIPVNSELSVALNLKENTLFIKTMQNGNITTLPYKIVSWNSNNQNNSIIDNKEENFTNSYESHLEKLEERIKKLEEKYLNDDAGGIQGLL